MSAKVSVALFAGALGELARKAGRKRRSLSFFVGKMEPRNHTTCGSCGLSASCTDPLDGGCKEPLVDGPRKEVIAPDRGGMALPAPPAGWV